MSVSGQFPDGPFPDGLFPDRQFAKDVPLTALITIYLWVFLNDQSRVLFLLHTYTCAIFLYAIVNLT